MTRYSFAIATTLPCAIMLSACAAAHDAPPVPVGPQSYTMTFNTPVPAESFPARFPGLSTWAYFGAEPTMRQNNQQLDRALQATSRSWPGIQNIYVDSQFCPGVTTPAVRDGALELTAAPLSPVDRVRCHAGNKDWSSAYVSSLPSFSQTYGYWEIEALLPCDPGRWPAFWLLPKTKTATNAGRLAEVDVFEHYGGPITVTSQGKPFIINRVGQPFSTLHWGVSGNEQKATNAQPVKPASDTERQDFCAKWHRFGVNWTKQEFRFFIDGQETFRTPNPGVNDPHYWVLNLDISPRAGDVSEKMTPSTYRIRSVRVWRSAIEPAGPSG